MEFSKLRKYRELEWVEGDVNKAVHFRINIYWQFFIMNEIRIFESELKNGTGKISLAYAIYSSASLMPPFVIAKAASASGISGES